ncbi:MAG: RidA family protein [Chloroflexi bacterium]|jgi:enamine deaminase RidA (YjgF/YER057c/UK114 family)|uniref:RidA family protein n=1 Tax=Candidatus Thermofonsia Clade 3 bacterium TaxID=2364212 RepID=A0A2M8QFN2_9CHLR|nr:RidA family protein [Candidatus Roseilinea sp. NK_OTU-006]PJF48617.1 MAG: hypothetical protein CUN48_02725 [Candidatus Thermofonsia Clade 3 bacterium]RMG62428.1 MAG: RidA family protein [Chloroflexota bacterium]
MIHRPEGNFSYLAGGGAFCRGVRADAGFVLVHATFRRVIPVAQAFEAIRRHLESVGRPMAALCGAEVRVPQPLTFESFSAFNQDYIALLDQYGLRQDGRATMTRTNVAPLPATIAPSEPGLFAFTYTAPRTRADDRKAFIVSGAGELKDGPPTRESIVRVGETTPDAMREKAKFVMASIEGTLKALGATWDDATQVNLYTAHIEGGYLDETVFAHIGPAGHYGLHWMYSKPPIQEVEFELDVRGTSEELFL